VTALAPFSALIAFWVTRPIAVTRHHVDAVWTESFGGGRAASISLGPIPTPKEIEMFRMAVLVVFAVVAVMATPNLAAAATVSTEFGSSVVYEAAAGESNQLAVTASAGSTSGTKKLVFQESNLGVIVTAGSGCTVTGINTVTCDNLSASFNVAVTVLGDMDDTVTAMGSFQALGLRLDGQGGSGVDTLTGGDGNDHFDGNHSSNPAQTGIGNDTINGGTGFDTAAYFFATGPVTATANGTGGQPGETDVLNSIEGLWGSDCCDDTLNGDGVPNDFVGFGGNDTINADGGGADTVRCDGLFEGSPEGNNDTANLDPSDTLGSDHGCEHVNISGGGDPPPGGEPPTKDECKKYGWMAFGDTYKNQGRCISDR
jgi:hypothetical protein